MSDLNIYQRINAIMSDCDYLQKERAQQGKGVRYDTVMAMLRDLLIKHGVVMVIRQTEMAMIEGVGTGNQRVYQGGYEMDLVNIDKPEDKVTHSAYAHGMDGGDKAPGKAQTYAVKIMLVKGFGIETGEDEESRAEKIDKKNTVSGEQIAELERLVTIDKDGVKAWGPKHAKVLKAYNINNLSLLPASKYDEVIARLNK